MIKNKRIEQEVKKQTGDDVRAAEIIMRMLDIESEGKQFSRSFKTLIENDVKEGIK